MDSEKKNKHRKISIILFAAYSCVLIYFLFFAENLGRVTPREYSFNVILFREITRYLTGADVFSPGTIFLNLAGNIIAFVPFGFFITPVLNGRTGFKEAVMLSFDVSLLVELIQLVTRVGSFDVDDLLLNTLGGLIGASVFFIRRKIVEKGAVTGGETQI